MNLMPCGTSGLKVIGSILSWTRSIASTNTCGNTSSPTRSIWRESSSSIFTRYADAKVNRAAFADSCLIYAPGESGWFLASECVWANSGIHFADRASIADEYAELEDFFKDMLGVKPPDISMHVEALTVLGTPPSGGLFGGAGFSRSHARIKESIILISSLNPTSLDLERLSAIDIFRVRLADGTFLWTRQGFDFAINDRGHYAEAFKDLAAILDFTLEEVRAADRFFHALGMGKQYLSALVVESTNVANGAVHAGLTRSLQSRSFALCR